MFTPGSSVLGTAAQLENPKAIELAMRRTRRDGAEHLHLVGITGCELERAIGAAMSELVLNASNLALLAREIRLEGRELLAVKNEGVNWGAVASWRAHT